MKIKVGMMVKRKGKDDRDWFVERVCGDGTTIKLFNAEEMIYVWQPLCDIDLCSAKKLSKKELLIENERLRGLANKYAKEMLSFRNELLNTNLKLKNMEINKWESVSRN